MADDAGGLLSLLRERHQGRFGVLWISPDRYPVLTVGINGEHAWLCFMPDEETAGFLSQGSVPPDLADVEFMNDDLQPELRPATCVVPVLTAEEAALQFFRTGVLPQGLDWLEL